MIAVVIPYFQREPGILANALRSVFASEGVEDVCVIVVDDASPVSARSEIAEMGATRFPVKIIHQPNGGPGAARNTGLDNLPDDVDYVAFLDSDDTWSPQHLNNALMALRAGYDVYFCDLMQLGADISGFRRAGRIDPSTHSTIPGRTDLHAYQGDMFNQIITGNIIGTSTVMFDWRKFNAQRFRTDLTSAGEDYLFWLEFSHRKARFVFGSTPSVFYGKGVNIYAGAVWGTDGHARRIVDELSYRKAVLLLYQLTEPQHAFVKNAIRILSEGFVADCLHRIAHGKPIAWKLVFTMLHTEPKTGFRAIKVLLNKVVALIAR
jgi:succinoglycan biosynthesis protein ExoW